MDPASTNGGFPLPLDSQPARLVSARHEACGRETRVRLPRALPARAVRRVVCAGCAEPFEAAKVAESRAGGRLPALPSLPSVSSLPRPSRETAWRWASVPAAAAVVVLGLNALQGGDETAAPPSAEPAAERVAGPGAARAGRVVDVTGPGAAASAARAGDAQLVSESTYSLALPAEWDRVSAQGGATFGAVAPGGEADATLWIERDPKLDFASFEARSLDQLEQLAGSAKVVERTTGPTPEATSIRIAADAPPGAPRYEVLLRSAGDYWYYLATTVQPDAPAAAIAGVELLQGSLVPEGGH